jgi:ABC-2 type transport system permease protein
MDAKTNTLRDAVSLNSRHYGPINWLGLQTLIEREIRRFWKVGAQTVIAPLISTILYMTVFALVLAGRNWHGTDKPAVDGLAAGLVMMSILSNAFQNSASSIVIAKVQGNSVDFLMPPLSGFELTVAFIVGAAARGLLVGFVSLLSVSFFAHNLWPEYPLIVIYYALMASIIFGAIGLIGGVWADKFDHIAAVTNFVVLPLTFLSGTFYSVNALPGFFRTVSHWNPVFFLIDGFRFGFIGAHDADLLTGATVSFVLAALLCAISWRMLASGYKMRS